MTAISRPLPPILFGGRRANRLVERNVLVYRRQWMFLVSGFFEPFFYLIGIGFGIGALVGTIPGPDGRPMPYGLFVAPAMLASSAMNGAILDSTFGTFFKLNYQKTYDAILATPLGVGDIALGEIAWALIRGTIYGTGFVLIMAILGLASSPLAVFAIPAALLIGFAFAAVGMAATTWMRSWQDFDLITLVTLPLFLFSGTFYPISSFPAPLQLVVQLTPLYHGVNLVRGLTTGVLGPGAVIDVGYLVLMGLLGLAVAGRRLDKLLLK